MKLEYGAWRQLFGFYTNFFLSSCTEPNPMTRVKNLWCLHVLFIFSVEMNLNQFAHVILQLNRITSSTVYFIHRKTQVNYPSQLYVWFVHKTILEIIYCIIPILKCQWTEVSTLKPKYTWRNIILYLFIFFQGDIYSNIAMII